MFLQAHKTDKNGSRELFFQNMTDSFNINTTYKSIQEPHTM